MMIFRPNEAACGKPTKVWKKCKMPWWSPSPVQSRGTRLVHNIPMGFWVQCCQIPATSPLEWYFNGDQTLALPIPNIPMALRFQNSGHHSPLEWYFKTLAFPILHISMASWVQSCKIPATVADWNDISMWSWHCQFFKFLWPYDFKIPATITQWNDIPLGSNHHWHYQFFTFLWPFEFKVAKFWPP